MTPKFRLHDRTVRDNKRKRRAETLHRRAVRALKYDTAAVRTTVNA